MDPLSLILGGVTICQVVGKIISLSIAYGQSVTNLPAEVQTLISEIALLSGVLTSLCSTAAGITTPNLLWGLAECQKQLEELHEYLVKHQGSGGRLKEIGRALKWPMKEQETMEWIAKMERYKTTFSLALQNEELSITKAIFSDVADIKMAQESERVEKKRKKQSKDFGAAMAWVTPVDPKVNHLAARKLQQSGTGRWFTESGDFTSWKDSESSFLWLYGSAGAGKTILSSIILDHLMQEEEAGAHAHTKTVYFYCDFKDSQKSNPTSIYGSLVAQILEAHFEHNLPDQFAKFYDRNKANPPQEDMIKAELLKLIRTVGHTRIVVDALDECPPSARTDLLKTLLEFKQTGKVNLLITSREEVDIKSALGDTPKLCINALVNSRDIQLFVAEECERNSKLRRKLKGAFRLEVISTVSIEARGMFRWAKCTLDQIARLRNDRAIKQALKSLPPDLNETYERILNNISEDDKELSLRIFRWLTCALRPMKIQEVVEGIALELGDSKLDPETFLCDPEDILDICGSLVDLNLDARTVTLAHFSVKEFFISQARKLGPHPDFFIDPVTTNFELAKLCVTYVKFEHFRDGPCATGQELRRRSNAYALYRYASNNWAGHAREYCDSGDEEFLSITKPLFVDPDNNGNFDAWRQMYEVSDRMTPMEDFAIYLKRDADPATNRLIYACLLGLYPLAKALITDGIGLKAITNEGAVRVSSNNWTSRVCGNALNAACESRNLKVVELVVSSGADVNAIAGRHECALHAAINPARYSGYPDDYRITKYLLDQGANVNITTPEGLWPLYVASNCGSVEGVRLCLAAGAEVGRRKSSDDYTEFENAALFSKAEIFELLRQHGGGKHIHPEFGMENVTLELDGYGLWLASQSNFFESAQKILETDGEKLLNHPLWEKFINHTFMDCAANGYHRYLKQMLAYAQNPPKCYTECVKLAASQGWAETLRVLFDFKAPKRGDTLLCDLLVMAAGRGHQGVMKELITRGVPPFASNKHGWTAALAAATSAYSKEVQNPTLEAFREIGNGFEKLESRVLKPSGWQLRLERYGPVVPKLITEGTSAYFPSGERRCHVTFNHPIPPSAPYYYFEITIEKMPSLSMRIGIASTLTEYDSEGPSSIDYLPDGQIVSPTSRKGGFPKYTESDVIGCAVDLKRRIAIFTCNGKIVEASCSDVRGMVYGIISVGSGDRIKANFGDEPFGIDTTVFEKGLEAFAVQPKLEFRTGPFVDPFEPVISSPDQRFVG